LFSSSVFPSLTVGPEKWGLKTLKPESIKAALDEMRNLSGEAPRLVLGEVHIGGESAARHQSEYP
jgi:hypothetical protein